MSSRSVPSIADAAALLAVVLALTVASALIGGAAAQLVVFQIVAVGMPVAVFAWLHPAPAAELLALGRPRLAALGGAALAGFGVLLVNLIAVVPLSLWIFGVKTPAGPELGALPLAVELVALAAIPALCEELLFRSVFFRALAARSVAAALVLSPLLFAMFHLSAPRLLPAATVGLVASVVMWRSASSWAAISCHFANNAALIAIAAEPGVGELLPAGLWGVLGALALGAGLLILPADRGRE